MRTALSLAAALLLLPSVTWAFTPPSQEDPGPRSPFASQVYDKPLPELKGVVSWKTLAEIVPVKQKDRFVPGFSPAVQRLDKQQVKLQGFMLPLEMGDRQTHFILTSTPPGCAFCLPGGPDSLVEVKTKTPVRYSFEPVVLSGRFQVLKDDPTGLFYRLTDAVLVGR